ncbi:hypothetical protein FKW31_06900 [Acetobacter sp. DmW_136]|uniref:hypothetical protein n=1 Tax=Acetobacter sp. DmW_136 TaxID=2591091 RepID=UPI00123A3922|nr:hypothetical protein [Acetobacter sp. DmW_136]KAA8386235.1 hypothetical protein FKW31_06900 [Acetobacter sp. DmW_136]
MNIKNSLISMSAFLFPSIGFAQTASHYVSEYSTTSIVPCIWVKDATGSGWQIGDIATVYNDGSVIEITKVNKNGSIADFIVKKYAKNLKNYQGKQYWSPNPHAQNDADPLHKAACFRVNTTSLNVLPAETSRSIMTDVKNSAKQKNIQTLFDLVFSSPSPYFYLDKTLSYSFENGPPLTLPNYLDKSTTPYTSASAVINMIEADTSMFPQATFSGLSFPYAGDSFPTLSVPPRDLPTLTLGRIDQGRVDNTAPSFSINYVNNDPVHGRNSIDHINKRNIDINTVVTPQAISSTRSLSNFLEDDGMQGYGQQNYAFQNVLHKKGLSWSWATAEELDETQGLDYTYGDRNAPSFGQLSTVEFVAEHNLNAVGYDLAATSYDAQTAHRINQLASNGLWEQYVPFWKPDTPFAPHQMIRVVDPRSGMQHLFVSDQGGTSGEILPRFEFTGTRKINDASVKWLYLGPLKAQIGLAFSASSNCHIPTYPENYNGNKVPACSEIGAAFAAPAHIYNTVFDASASVFVQPGIHSWARTQADTYLDLTADSTSSGLNKHILGYDSKEHALQYRVKTEENNKIQNNNPIFSVKDTGELTTQSLTTKHDANINGKVTIGDTLKLPSKSKEEIKQITSAKPGEIIYDTTDDAPVIYTKHGWKIIPLISLK